MEGREAMSYGDSGLEATYFPQQTGVNVSVVGSHTRGVTDATAGFRQASSGQGDDFQIDNSDSNYHQLSINMGSLSGSEPVKKKRGRPRKYVPEKSIALELTPMSETASQGSIGSREKRKRGRPLGSGRKQQLASLGGWMNSSAGSAFAPNVLFIEAGEDVAAKILQFALLRPRALCIMSGSGTVSSVSLRQPASSDNIFTYKGHFHILCLSGSYLVSEEGRSDERTGGLNISLSSLEGHVLGGVIDGPLIADSPVQVVMCSFTYDSSKSNIRGEEPARLLKYEQEETEQFTNIRAEEPARLVIYEKEETEPFTTASSRLDNNLTPRTSLPRNSDTGIDLMLG